MNIKTQADNHFDHIDYDAQIPPHIRDYLARRKVNLMIDAINRMNFFDNDLMILDAGCGTGDHIKQVWDRGFRNIYGIDISASQINKAKLKNPFLAEKIIQGDILSRSFSAENFHVSYSINAIHHLPTAGNQLEAMNNLINITKTGGLIIIHEMNIQNPIFNFYLRRIFPKIRKIDTGCDELFLKPHFFYALTNVKVIDLKYYTFMPDFMPKFALNTGIALESFLEKTPLKSWSAHYMVVLRKIS